MKILVSKNYIRSQSGAWINLYQVVHIYIDNTNAILANCAIDRQMGDYELIIGEFKSRSEAQEVLDYIFGYDKNGSISVRFQENEYVSIDE